MTTASSQTHLKRRLDDYIWHDKGLPMERLRELLRTQFMPLGEVYVIGGLVRDIARFGKTKFKSDVDLVFNVAPKKIERFAIELGATPNQFGGYGLRTPLWKIDFWSLRNTWAHKAGHVSIRDETDLLKCTFFDIDSIIYNLSTREITARPGYLEIIRNRRIDINLRPNPSEDGNLLRAMRRVLSWNLSPGPRLSEFFVETMNEQMFANLQAAEERLYTHQFSKSFDDYEDLLEALLRPRVRKLSHHGVAAQYALPF